MSKLGLESRKQRKRIHIDGGKEFIKSKDWVQQGIQWIETATTIGACPPLPPVATPSANEPFVMEAPSMVQPAVGNSWYNVRQAHWDEMADALHGRGHRRGSSMRPVRPRQLRGTLPRLQNHGGGREPEGVNTALGAKIIRGHRSLHTVGVWVRWKVKIKIESRKSQVKK